MLNDKKKLKRSKKGRPSGSFEIRIHERIRNDNISTKRQERVMSDFLRKPEEEQGFENVMNESSSK